MSGRALPGAGRQGVAVTRRMAPGPWRADNYCLQDRPLTVTAKGTAIMKTLFAALALSLAAGWAHAAPADLAATVNGTPITRDKVQTQVDQLLNARGRSFATVADPQVLSQMQHQVLDRLITQELLWQEARAKGFSVSDEVVNYQVGELRSQFPDEATFLARLESSGLSETEFREDIRHRLSVEALISGTVAAQVTVSEEEIEAFYQENLDQMRTPEQVRARNIMIHPEADTEEARQQARETLAGILEQARAGADFAELARQHSQAPSAADGGDLGYFSKGQMVGPFDKVAFELDPGAISDIVEIQSGYHIVKVEEHIASQAVPLEEASVQVRDYLVQAKIQEGVKALAERLRDEAKVEVLLDR